MNIFMTTAYCNKPCLSYDELQIFCKINNGHRVIGNDYLIEDKYNRYSQIHVISVECVGKKLKNTTPGICKLTL